MDSFSFLSSFLGLFVLIACNVNSERSGTTTKDGKVSVEVFKSKLSAVSDPQLIDVRTPQEFSQGTLEGAVNINYRGQDIDNQLNTLNKTKPVFIFCRSGGRSGECYTKMKNMGFSKVYDMDGGYLAWTEQNLIRN